MELQAVKDDQHLDLILRSQEAVLYKHGPMCWASVVAKKHVRTFASRFPDVPVFIVDAVAQRPLARRIAELLDIRHESPQAIILLNGQPVWNASHYRVTADALEYNFELYRQRVDRTVR